MLVSALAYTASALTDYADVYKTKGLSIPVNQRSGTVLDYSTPAPTGMDFTNAFLTPTESASISCLFPAFIVGLTSRNTHIIPSAKGRVFNSSGAVTLALNSMALNNHSMAHNGHIDTRFFSSPGLMSTGRLQGTGPLAPEPIAMALIGAAIVALPLARRLRRSIKKET
jgi:hypothetical protein